MSPEEKEAILRTIESVGALTLGATLAVLITHRLTMAREKANGLRQRKRAFLAFMASWEYEIGRSFMHHGGGGFERRDSAYADVISSFVHEAGIIRWDFSKRKRQQFDTLCSAITDAKHPTIYNKEDHNKAAKALDDIMDFVEKNL